MNTIFSNEFNEILVSFSSTCEKILAPKSQIHKIWEKDGLIDLSFWRELGQAGILGVNIDSKYGGSGLKEYDFQKTFIDKLIELNFTVPCFVAHMDVITSYLSEYANQEQKKRLLPDLCAGRKIAAIAITEPHTGSDLTALKTYAKDYDADHYIVNGKKIFITNGYHADVFILAVKFPEDGPQNAISLLIVEKGMKGFESSDPLKKLGWHASDTTELFLDNCIVPKTNVLGKKHLGSMYFMKAMCRERLSISTVALSTATKMLNETLYHIKNRTVFGTQIGQLQYNKFSVSELSTELKIACLFLENCIAKFNQGELSFVESAQLKWFCTELQNKIADRCLQLHGGMGYMQETSIARDWTNSRVQKIYGGSSEVMLEIIGKSLGL